MRVNEVDSRVTCGCLIQFDPRGEPRMPAFANEVSCQSLLGDEKTRGMSFPMNIDPVLPPIEKVPIEVSR